MARVGLIGERQEVRDSPWAWSRQKQQLMQRPSGQYRLKAHVMEQVTWEGVLGGEFGEAVLALEEIMPFPSFR